MQRFLRSSIACIALMTCAAPIAAQTVLTFGHSDQVEGTRHAAAQLFARKVEELTKGRYKIQVHCCSHNGADVKQTELVSKGKLDLTVTSTGSYAHLIPSLNLLMLPYLVDNFEQGWKLYDNSKWVRTQLELAPAKGLHFLATWEAGFRNMTTREPLNSPRDAKGKVMRTFANEMMRWTLEAMGFDVLIMPLPEVHKAIASGQVSGQENPVDTIFSNKFYEVAPIVTMTQHVYSPLLLSMSEESWKSLSAENQTAFVEAGRIAGKFSRSLAKAVEEKQLAGMSSRGANVVRPVLGPFRDVVQPVYGKARQKYGADVDALLADAAAARKTAK